MKNILTIDTSDRNRTEVCLTKGDQKIVLTDNTYLKTQITLPLIEKLLIKSKTKLTDLTEIRVNPGPGSFVGLRVGISIANTLAYLLKIPVNGKSPPALPVYL